MTHVIPASGRGLRLGLDRDGGTPEFGLNFAGDCGGELVSMNWCGPRVLVPGEFACAVVSEALRQKASGAMPRLFCFQKAGDTGMECVQVLRELLRVKIRQ